MTNQLVGSVPFVSSVEELLLLKRRQTFQYKCQTCGALCIAKKRTEKARIEKQALFLCQLCLTKHTSIEKYGTDFPNQSELVKDKIKESNVKHYGVVNVFQSDIIKEKSKNTCIQKYGTEYANQSEQVKEKIRNTNVEKYGVENTFQAEQFKEKSRKTCKERYGTEWYASTNDCKERLKETNLKLYGVEYALQSKEVREKGKKTCMNKYGKEYYNQTTEHRQRCINTCLRKYGEISYTKTEEYQRLARRKYQFNGEFFDSSWEVYFFYYCLKTGKHIIRNVKELKFELHGKTYEYFPDFEVDGKLYEIKGDHFFKNDGTLCNPYNHKLDERFEAKHQCGLRNGVIFLRGKDIIPMKKLFNNDFGKDYINKLRVNI